MKKMIIFMLLVFSLKTTAQLPSAPSPDSLVKIINQGKYIVYFGSGIQLGNAGYAFTISVSSTGWAEASWINGSFKGQLYADGQCVGSWKHVTSIFKREPMQFKFSPNGQEAIGQYTKDDRTRLIKIKKE